MKILRYFLKRWYLFAASVIFAIIVVTIYHRFQTQVYSLSTTMMIEDKTANILMPDGMTSIINARGIDNEIAMLKSYSQVSQIIDQLDFDVSYFAKGEMRTREIYKDAPFVVRFDPLANKTFEKPVGLKFLSGDEFILSTATNDFDPKQIFKTGQLVQAGGFSFTVNLKENDDNDRFIGKNYSFILHTKDQLVKSYRNKISIRLERGTSILTISSSGSNIQKEKDFLNTLARVYIESNLERKNQISNSTISFIDDQLGQIRESLGEVEKKLEDFRKANKLMRLTDKAVPILQRVNNLEKSKADQMLDLKYYQYLRDYLLTHDDVDDLVAPSTVGISLPLFSDLLLKLSTTYLEKEDLMANSTKENPYIQILETEIQNQKRMLVENISDIIKIAEMKIADYDKQINENLEDFEKLPQLEREYIEIERINKLNSEMYTYLLEKRAEAGIARANDVADLVLVDKAGDSGIIQVAPNKRSNLMSAILIALVVPSLILFLLYFMNNKLSEPEELKEGSIPPLAGILGNYSSRSPVELINKPHHDFIHALKKIKIRIPAAEEGKGNVIGITSTIFGDGKTFIAASLALSYALSGKKTLLIDLNFEKQGLKSVFSPVKPAGISRGEPLLLSDNPNLSVYFADDHCNDVDSLVLSDDFKKWMSSFRSRFEVIICDMAPVGLTTDAQEISSFIDTFLFVAREGHTPKKLFFQTIEQLSLTGIAGKILIVYNDSSSVKRSYSYDYYRQKEARKGLSRLIFQVRHRLT